MSRRDLPARGLTLIEIMVASAVFALLSLLSLSLFLPAQRVSSEANQQMDFDREARRFLAELRGELRNSGRGDDGSARFTVSSDSVGDRIVFRQRLGPGDALDTTRASADPGWSTEITWRLEEAGTLTGSAGPETYYSLVREQDGQRSIRLQYVREFDLEHLAPGGAGADAIALEFTLIRPFPYATGGASRDLVRRTYTDRIQLLNRGTP